MSYKAERRFRGTTSFRTPNSPGIKAPASSYSQGRPTAWVDPGPSPFRSSRPSSYSQGRPTAWVDPGPRATVAADRKLRNLGILSGTVFGDDEETAMPAMDVSDPEKDIKIKAGCQPYEIVATPGTSPYEHCQQLVAGYTSSPGGSILDFLTGGSVTAAQKQAAAANKSSTAGSIATAIFGALTAPKMPMGPYPYPPPQQGMSSTTKLALLGGGALLLVALLR